MLHELLRVPGVLERGAATAELIGLGLVLHELVYLSSRGVRHFTTNTAPVLGLHLPGYARHALHLVLTGTSVSLVLVPTQAGVIACLAALSLYIACFPARLANHLIVAWFFLLALTLDGLISGHASSRPGDLGLGLIQLMTALTYGIAGFHKLNRDYVRPETSCGAGVIVHYLLQKGVRLRRWPRMAGPLGIHVIIIAEFLLPLALILGPARPAMTVAVVLHLAFGFLAHIHFSTVMLAGLLAFCPDQGSLVTGASYWPLAALVVAIPLGHILGNHGIMRWRRLAWACHVLFALIGVLAARALWSTPSQNLIGDSMLMAPGVLIGVAMLFLLNGLAPYLGLKFDFSLAMFSNLRPDVWNHLVMPRPRYPLAPRYVRVEHLVSVAGDDSVARRAQDEVHNLFPLSGSHVYAVGYVRDAVRDIERRLGQSGIGIAVTFCDTSAPCIIRSTFRLRQRERVSVFPYALPLGNEPLFH